MTDDGVDIRAIVDTEMQLAELKDNPKIDPKAKAVLADSLETIAISLWERHDDVRVSKRYCAEQSIRFASVAENLCESPIEQMMLAGLIGAIFGYQNSPYEIWDTTLPFPKPNANVVLAPQHKLGGYRVDIAVFVIGLFGNELKFAIECDGHNYHERTKEQASRDKKRDRYFQSRGWVVFRYTGSDIYNDPHGSAQDVGRHIDEILDRELQEHGLIRGRVDG